MSAVWGLSMICYVINALSCLSGKTVILLNSYIHHHCIEAVSKTTFDAVTCQERPLSMQMVCKMDQQF